MFAITISNYMKDWVIYSVVKAILVPEAICEAKEMRGAKEEPLVTSVD